MREESTPVRFRLVLQITFPEADPYDPSAYQAYLNSVLEAIRNAKNVKCTDVVMREASTISPSEEYQDWSGGPKFDFEILTPSVGEVFGLDGYPAPSVVPGHVASVWAVLSKAEGGELGQNVSVAVGQVLGPEANTNVVIARTYILRVLKSAGYLQNRVNEELFARAATIPLERAPLKASDLAEYAALFE